LLRGDVMNRLSALAYRLYGAPPPKGAPRVELLRWIRGVQLTILPLGLVACGVLLIWAGTTWLIVAGVGLLISLENLISLSVKIRREERRERG
jgi:hypothetical protein